MDLFDAQVGDGLCALAKYQHNCSGHATTRRCFQVNRQIGLGNSSCTRGFVDEKFEELTRRLAPHAVCLHASFCLLFLFLYLPAVSAAAAVAAPAPVLAARGERASVIVTSISRDTTSFHVLLLVSSTHYQVLRGDNSPCVQRTCSTQRRQFSFGRRFIVLDVLNARVSEGLYTLAETPLSCSVHAHYEALLPGNCQI
jgi:hypothetical protein